LPGLIPRFKRSSSLNLECVVEPGCVAIERASPRLEVYKIICKASKKRKARAAPPFTSKVTIPPPAFICLVANSYCGCDGKNGYFTSTISGCFSNVSANANALLQCLSIRKLNVSRLFDNTQALKGDIDGPVCRIKNINWSIKFCFPTI